MRIDGGCHCGFITYEAKIDPKEVKICHCTDCQILSGSAFRTVARVEEEKFKLMSGQPKKYIKTAESGNKRVQMFCPECGTPICSTGVGGGQHISLRVGTARQRDQLSPKRQIWFRSAQGWVTDMGSIPSVEKQ